MSLSVEEERAAPAPGDARPLEPRGECRPVKPETVRIGPDEAGPEGRREVVETPLLDRLQPGFADPQLPRDIGQVAP